MLDNICCVVFLSAVALNSRSFRRAKEFGKSKIEAISPFIFHTFGKSVRTTSFSLSKVCREDKLNVSRLVAIDRYLCCKTFS